MRAELDIFALVDTGSSASTIASPSNVGSRPARSASAQDGRCCRRRLTQWRRWNGWSPRSGQHSPTNPGATGSLGLQQNESQQSRSSVASTTGGNMELNPDFQEFLRSFVDHDVRFLTVADLPGTDSDGK